MNGIISENQNHIFFSILVGSALFAGAAMGTISPKIIPLTLNHAKILTPLKSYAYRLPHRAPTQLKPQVERMDTHEMSIQTIQSSALAVELNHPEIKELNLSADLTEDEKQKLKNLLLSEQWSSIEKRTLKKPHPTPQKNKTVLVSAQETAKLQVSAVEGVPVGHKFERIINNPSPGVDISVKPEKVTWLSDSRKTRNWFKAEVEGFLPTLALHPAPNGGPTVMMDGNAIAAISIRAQLKQAKGAGVIFGVVPDGFKIEFAGRSEETQYFTSNGKEMFAILNAEPGSQVLELISQTDTNQTTTVFVPVLEDVVTYADLGKPEKKSFSVRIAKERTEDLSNLKVSISTQPSIQRITNARGGAKFENLWFVRGFQVYLDVTSRKDTAQGFTYRYAVDVDSEAEIRLDQISENILNEWLSQVSQGVSDQSAMVVAQYDRVKFGGFKNHYFGKVTPITARLGLDPINYTVLWDQEISKEEPLEGDAPRFMALQVPEGISKISLVNEAKKEIVSQIIPISPRVIHMVNE